MSPPCAETYPEPPTYPALWKEGPANARRRQKNLCPLSLLHPHRVPKSLVLWSPVGETEAQRVQLRFGRSGLKVTGLSFLACVPSYLDVFIVSGS